MRRILNLILTIALLVASSVVDKATAEDTRERPMPAYRLSVSFDLLENSLKGKAEIDLPESADVFVPTGNLRVLSVRFSGKPVGYSKDERVIKAPGKGRLEIEYEGVFRGEKDGGNPRNAGVVRKGVISAEGISLTGNWYPVIKGLAVYRLSALVPAGFTAISEAEEITSRETPAGREYSFLFPHPLNGIDFVAGNYRESRDSIDGIDIYAYFFPVDESLAATYIGHAKEYFRLYNSLLVPYPYKRFSIVENIQTTGYSMPTFTLLGQEVVRLPFIVKTSLGHEITHQWFGNYVYADFEKGNWLEAITTYLSDHLYEEQKGKGWEYRKKILQDYRSYVTPEKEFPLRAFFERSDFASAAIGYGKGAMVFHMLRTMLGDDVFYNSLRSLIENNRFRNATWEDLRLAFEKVSGRELGWFFTEWLDRKGVPSVEIRDAKALVLKGVPTVSFRLLQKGEPYRLSLPIEIVAPKGAKKEKLEIGKDRQYFEIAANENPGSLVADGNYDVMRRLSDEEFPPVISRLLGDERRLLVYDRKDEGIYRDLIGTLAKDGFILKETREVKDEDIRTSSLLVLGYSSPVLSRLFGDLKDPGRGFVLTVRNNPLNMSKVVAYANAGSEEEVRAAAPKIFHYGKYSSVRFEQGRNTEKSTKETDRGLIYDLVPEVRAVVPKRSIPIGHVVDDVAERPVVFVGERHTNYEDHKVELDVIMGMHMKGRKIAIGMEMFQRPFQKVLDDYVSGLIDEREFLKRSEYFKRWRFDYNLYREILEYAKANRIPIVALNIKEEIVDKVAAKGLDGLTAEEMREVPADMDMSDDQYEERLREIFETHPQGTRFENFYQAQILWDETMAHSAAEFLKEHPDFQMVILAGAEHVMYSSGIPSRLNRLTGREYATIINGNFDTDIGSYVVFAEPVEPPFSAKMGTILRKKGDRVVIGDLLPDSAAFKAGMKKGDAILLIDGLKIDSVEDVRIALFDKRPYESAKIRVLRKKLLFGEKELEFDLKF